MKNTTSQATLQYIYNSANSGEAVVAGQTISVREADRAAQQLRKAHLAALA